MPSESEQKSWRNASTLVAMFVMVYSLLQIIFYGCMLASEQIRCDEWDEWNGYVLLDCPKKEPATGGWIAFFVLMFIPCIAIIGSCQSGPENLSKTNAGHAAAFVIGSVVIFLLLLIIWTCWDANSNMMELNKLPSETPTLAQSKIMVVMQVFLNFAHFFAIYVGMVVVFITALVMEFGLDLGNMMGNTVELASNQVSLKFSASERGGVNYKGAEITSVEGQAERLGVKAGWQMVTINGEKYTAAKLVEAATGGKDYEIVFAVPVVAVTSEVTKVFEVTEKIGLDFANNLVTGVNGQAEKLGVQTGWTLLKVNDASYSTAALREAAGGTEAFSITFGVPEGVPIKGEL